MLFQDKLHNQSNYERLTYNCDFCEDKLKSKAFLGCSQCESNCQTDYSLKKHNQIRFWCVLILNCFGTFGVLSCYGNKVKHSFESHIKHTTHTDIK